MAAALRKSSQERAGMSGWRWFHRRASAWPGPISRTQRTWRAAMLSMQSSQCTVPAICSDSAVRAPAASRTRPAVLLNSATAGACTATWPRSCAKAWAACRIHGVWDATCTRSRVACAPWRTASACACSSAAWGPPRMRFSGPLRMATASPVVSSRAAMRAGGRPLTASSPPPGICCAQRSMAAARRAARATMSQASSAPAAPNAGSSPTL